MVVTEEYLDKYLNELASFQSSVFENEQGLLKNILDYAFQNEGKKIRSTLILLSAQLFGEVNRSTLIAATLIELLHNATLLHDDVVDNAATRRGQASVNNMFGDKASVLAGDYLLSKTLSLSAENDEFYLLKLVSDTLVTISKGELIQIESKLKNSFNEESHFNIIEFKTASLISACFKAGAHSTKVSGDRLEQIALVGKYLGIAYQLKDDLIDFNSAQKSGKKQYQDIYDKKMTLPLIYSLDKCDKEVKQMIMELFSKEEGMTPNDIEQIISVIQQYKGFDYANSKQQEFTAKAISELNSISEPNQEAKTQLLILMEQLLKRDA